MDYQEYLGWVNYLYNNPVGWKDDLRTFKLMQAFGVKSKAEEMFSSLARMAEIERDQKNIGQSLVQSNAFTRMLSSAKEVPAFLKGLS